MCVCMCFELQSHVVQAGSELLILLSAPPKCGDYRCAPPQLLSLSLSLYGCMNVWDRVHAHTCEEACIRMRARGQHLVDVFIVSPLLFGVGSLAETGAHQLAKLARQASPRSSCLCLRRWDYTFTSGFLHGCCGDGS